MATFCLQTLFLFLVCIVALKGADPSPGKIYSTGPYSVASFSVAGSSVSQHGSVVLPPRPVLIFAPLNTTETLPVVQFHHGFMLENSIYSQLLSQISSFGYIIVAPQMTQSFTDTDATSEILFAAAVLDWLAPNLASVLPSTITCIPDFTKVAIVGHSRGGKVAFGVALQNVTQTKQQISAIAGLDPVDGKNDNVQSQPPILRYSPHSFNLAFPTLVVGSGLGPVKKFGFFPRCVPLRLGHAFFYNDSAAPAYHFVATNYGHMDLLNDWINPFSISGIASMSCASGTSRSPCRTFMGGITVAFLQDALQGTSGNLADAVANYSTHVNIQVDKPQADVQSAAVMTAAL